MDKKYHNCVNCPEKQREQETKAEASWLDQYAPVLRAMPESNGTRFYERLGYRIGIVCDRFFYDSIVEAAEFVYLTPDNWKTAIAEKGIDVLLFVSTWTGLHDEWTGVSNTKSEKGQEAIDLSFLYETERRVSPDSVVSINNEEYAGDIAVASEKTVEDVPGNTSSVVEHAASVDYDALYAAHPELEGIEFHPDSSSKTLVLTSEEAQNILTFYYSGYKHADIKLHFVDMAGNSIAGDDVQRCKIGETFNLARTPIDGWELYKVVEGDSLGGAEASSQYRVTEKTTKSGLEFTLFYQKKATVTALSARKQYDGKALTLPEAGSRVEGLLRREPHSG